MTRDDWTIADTDTAAEILNYLGIGSEASKEPFLDRRRDAIARIIRARVDYEIAQEREGCAFAAECHSGFGDPESIEACAALIRRRSDEPEDCIHVRKDAYAELIANSQPHKSTVKPLTWTGFELSDSRGSWYAPSLVGHYTIEHYVKRPKSRYPDRPFFCLKIGEYFATLEDAKGAVQKDYEEQLLSAFTNEPQGGFQE